MKIYDSHWQGLTLLLLNTICPDLANSVAPDQLAALFAYVCEFIAEAGSSNPIGWKLEEGKSTW